MFAPKACIETNPTGQSIKFGGEYINEFALARAQGISQSHVSRVLAGSRTPSMGIAIKIAAGLGLTIDELLFNIQCRKAEIEAEQDQIIAQHETRLRNERRVDSRMVSAGRVPAPRLTSRVA